MFNTRFKRVNTNKKFNAFAINEHKFNRKLRFKEWHCDFNRFDNSIDIEWVTQEDFEEVMVYDLLKEIERCIIKTIKFDGTIYLKVYSRNNDEFVVNRVIWQM
jgi:hypothetical protein